MTKSSRLDADAKKTSLFTDSRTQSPFILGGISVSGMVPEDRLSMGAMEGVGFDDDREQRRWNGRLGLDGTTDRNQINSQISLC